MQNAQQLNLLGGRSPVVHFFDRAGKLRSGRIIRRIQRGSRKGRYVVEDAGGKRYVPERIRNIE